MFASPVIRFQEVHSPGSLQSEENHPQIQVELNDLADVPVEEEIEPSDHAFWPTSTTYLFLRDKPLATAIIDFCKMQDISAVLSEKLQNNLQHVNQSFEKAYPVQIWEQLAKSCGLMWFYDGRVLYVYESDEIQTRILKIHPLQIEPLLQMIHEMKFCGSNMGIHPMREGGILVVSGAPKMIELLESITENMRLYKTSEMDRMDVKLFPLKHAWADDKAIGGLTIPGVATLLNNILGEQESTNNRLTPADKDSSAKKISSVREGEKEKEEKKADSKENKEKSKESDAAAETQDIAKSERGIITTDARQNAVIVKDYHHKLPMYQELIQRLDVPLELIEIHAAIVNVSKGCDLNVGTDSITVKSGKSEKITFKYLANAEADASNTSKSGLNFSLNGIVHGGQFLAAINALESKNLSKILARPSVVTMNNLTAVMDQSRTYYFAVEGYRSGDMYSVSGSIKLNVTPHLIEQDGQTCIQLILDIKDESVSPGKGEEKASTNSSSISTQALVYEGQSVLVGGYFSEEYQDGDKGVPFLKDIPILGYLFKTKTKNKTISERLFLITPKIIHLSSSDPYQGLFRTPSNLLDSRELMQIQCHQPGKVVRKPEETLSDSPKKHVIKPKKMTRTARLYAMRQQRKKSRKK